MSPRITSSGARTTKPAWDGERSAPQTRRRNLRELLRLLKGAAQDAEPAKAS